MSMNATDASPRDAATLRATVLFPEPVPPAIPITSGFMCGSDGDQPQRVKHRNGRVSGAWARLSQSCQVSGRGARARSVSASRECVNSVLPWPLMARLASLMRFRSALIATLLVGVGCAPPAALTAGDSSFTLVVAGTTDVHGRVRGWNYETNRIDTARGLSRAATIVDSARRSAPGRFLLLDAGDLLQGNSLTYVAPRVSPAEVPHPVLAAMNAMHYDAAALGNHEFNYGLPLLDPVIPPARLPLLAANARRPDGQRAYPAWTILERNGVHIGIVGATTPGSMVWDRDNLTGRLLIGDIVPAVREAVSEVRSAGADVVVLTVHSGLDGASSYDTVRTGVPSENVAARVARDVSGLDLILYGHSHQEVGDTLINGVLLFQPKNCATSVGGAELVMKRASARRI